MYPSKVPRTGSYEILTILQISVSQNIHCATSCVCSCFALTHRSFFDFHFTFFNTLSIFNLRLESTAPLEDSRELLVFSLKSHRTFVQIIYVRKMFILCLAVFHMLEV